MTVILRPHQERSVARIREAAAAGKKSVCFVAPTGFGKTEVAAHLIRCALDKGRRVWFGAPQVNLIEQTSRRLDKYGLDHGVIQASHWRTDYTRPLQLFSRDTIANRIPQIKNKPHLVIIDEAHMGTFGKSLTVLLEWLQTDWDCFVIVQTATPWRLDGKGFGRICDSLVVGAEIGELMDEGWLLRYRLFTSPAPDLSRVKTTAGDYNQDQLAEEMDRPEIAGNIIRDWHKHAEGRMTIAFAVNIAHAHHVAERFRSSGIPSEAVDSKTMDEREFSRRIDKFRRGETKVIVNVGTLTTGADFPGVGALAFLRPTKSFALWLQMAGRGLRPAHGKAIPGEHCVFLDHAGLRHEHGHLTDEIEWSLDDRKRKDDETETRRGFSCPGCGETFRGKVPSQCPCCGIAIRQEMASELMIPVENDVELVEDPAVVNRRERREYYAHCAEHAMTHGHKPAACDARFKAKFGDYPKRDDMKSAPVWTDWPCKGAKERAWIDPQTKLTLDAIHAGRQQTDHMAMRNGGLYDALRTFWIAKSEIDSGCKPEHVATRAAWRAISVAQPARSVEIIRSAILSGNMDDAAVTDAIRGRSEQPTLFDTDSIHGSTVAV